MVHSACRKSLFATRGAGIHRRPSRFPCALHPETGGATGRKNLFFPLPLFSELAKVLKIFDFNGAGHPSWVSRTHPFFPSRKSPLAALRLFPLLGFPAHTLHPQGVCSIRKAAQPLTTALPYRRGKLTTLLTISPPASDLHLTSFFAINLYAIKQKPLPDIEKRFLLLGINIGR